MSKLVLQDLQENADYRAHFVETLRASAAMLRGTGVAGTLSEGARVRVSYQAAQELLEVAARLCDHARVTDGRCRYCEAVIVDSDTGEPASWLARGPA